MRRGGFSRPGDAESWARKNMIELVRIREVEDLVRELTKRLKRLGIECNRHVKLDKLGNYKKSDLYDIDDEEDLVKNNFIIKMIFAGAFYPNYFTSIKIDLQEAIRMCYGKDFRNTVQVRNFPMEEGVLYSEKLCDMFKVCSKLVRCSFEDSKGFIEFNSKCEEVASNVNLGVYLAVQMRNLRIPLRLKRLNAKITYEKLKRLRQLRKSTSSNFNFTLNSSRTSRSSRSSNLN
ncbi:unnamed protein product, partial [Brachionus calyciflorus]